MAGEGRKRLKNGGEDRRGRWSLKRDVSPEDDRDGSWRASCRGGTDERLPQPDAWEKLPGLAGGEQGAHDEGRAANRTGMGFPPGVRDLFRLWGGELDLVEGQTAPGFGQQLPGLLAGGLFRAGIHAIMPDRLVAGRRHVLEVATQKLLRRQGLDVVALPRPGLRMVAAPTKPDALILAVFHPRLAQWGRFQVGQLRGRELGVLQQPCRVERPAGHVPGLITQHVERGRPPILRRRRDEHRPGLPVDPVEPIQPAADGRLLGQREGAGAQQRSKSLAEALTKPHHQGPHRHQTAWTRHVLPVPLRAQPAAGH